MNVYAFVVCVCVCACADRWENPKGVRALVLGCVPASERACVLGRVCISGGSCRTHARTRTHELTHARTTHASRARAHTHTHNTQVTQFYTAPTAIRSLMSYGSGPVRQHDLSSLRVLGCEHSWRLLAPFGASLFPFAPFAPNCGLLRLIAAIAPYCALKRLVAHYCSLFLLEHTDRQTHAHMQATTHARRARARARMHKHTHKHPPTHPNPPTHTHTHTHPPTHPPTHTHTHTHTQVGRGAHQPRGVAVVPQRGRRRSLPHRRHVVAGASSNPHCRAFTPFPSLPRSLLAPSIAHSLTCSLTYSFTHSLRRGGGCRGRGEGRQRLTEGGREIPRPLTVSVPLSRSPAFSLFSHPPAQTETGGHMIAPLPGATPLKPGAATLPFFGVEVPKGVGGVRREGWEAVGPFFGVEVRKELELGGWGACPSTASRCGAGSRTRPKTERLVFGFRFVRPSKPRNVFGPVRLSAFFQNLAPRLTRVGVAVGSAARPCGSRVVAFPPSRFLLFIFLTTAAAGGD